MVQCSRLSNSGEPFEEASRGNDNYWNPETGLYEGCQKL